MYQRKDTFYTRAKAAGYRSRAAFKLQQLVQRRRLLHRGDCVVELGAWPGGWLQVAAEYVGSEGKIVGVDLQAIQTLAEPNVITVVGDISEARTRELVAQTCGRKADVLLSDLAPKLTGVRARDEAQAHALADSVIQWAGCILRPGGTLIVKLFMGEALSQYVERLRAMFHSVHLTRPEATRKGSAEMYAVATGFRSSAAKANPALDGAPK